MKQITVNKLSVFQDLLGIETEDSISDWTSGRPASDTLWVPRLCLGLLTLRGEDCTRPRADFNPSLGI